MGTNSVRNGWTIRYRHQYDCSRKKKPTERELGSWMNECGPELTDGMSNVIPHPDRETTKLVDHVILAGL